MGACEAFEERISAFIDGVLPPEEREALMEHMAACPDCQAYFDDQIAIQDALDRSEAQAPEGFASDVMEQVRRTGQLRPAREHRRIPLRAWQRWAGLAACCAVVLLGAWGLRSWGGAAKADQTAPLALPAGAARSAAGGEEECAQLEDDAAEDASDTPESKTDGEAPAAADAAISPAAAPSEEGAEQEAPKQQYALASGAPAAPEDCAPAVLSTASPLARTWLSETLGADWETGGVRALSQEEYAQLRTLLEEAGESFQEEPGEPGSWQLFME